MTPRTFANVRQRCKGMDGGIYDYKLLVPITDGEEVMQPVIGMHGHILELTIIN